jgi:adenine/guanine/hypoxanthine permease
MLRQVVSINWNYIGDALPAFVTMIFIPFSYSTAYGLIAGIMTYAIVNTTVYVLSLVSRGRIEPSDYDNREYWTIKPGGKLPWFVRLAGKAVGKNNGEVEKLGRENVLQSAGSSRDGIVVIDEHKDGDVVVSVTEQGEPYVISNVSRQANH